MIAKALLQHVVAAKWCEMLNLRNLLERKIKWLLLDSIEVVRKLVIEDVVQQVTDTHRTPFRLMHTFKHGLQLRNRTDSNLVPVEEVILQTTKRGIGSLVR